MRKIVVFLVFFTILSFLRILDSMLTFEALRHQPDTIKELNPFAYTDSAMAVFISPIPLAIYSLSILQFATMLFRPVDTLRNGKSGFFWNLLIKDSIEFPLLILLFMLLSVLQNTSLLFLESPLMPAFLDTLMYENPIIGLMGFFFILWIATGRLLKKFTIKIIIFCAPHKKTNK